MNLTRRRIQWWIGGALGAVVLLAAGLRHHVSNVPDDLDLSATRLSAEGLYRISYVSRSDPIPLNRIQGSKNNLLPTTARFSPTTTFTTPGSPVVPACRRTLEERAVHGRSATMSSIA